MYRSGKRQLKLVLFLLGCLLLFSVNLFAAATGKVRGTVIDKETNEPVIGASVQLEGTKLGAVTDFDGNYLINQVEAGTYKLRITSLEYNTAVIEDVKVSEKLASASRIYAWPLLIVGSDGSPCTIVAEFP